MRSSRFRQLSWNGTSGLVMGVLNVTPDSFSDGGRYASPNEAIAEGRQIFAAGAHVVDVGGESTRPGSQPVSSMEEKRRALLVIAGLAPYGTVSIDTYKAEVADLAIDAGAEIVNDISGGTIDSEMFGVVGKRGVTIILGHLRGTPQTMNAEAQYQDVVTDVVQQLRQRALAAQEAGIPASSIWLDPGLGFAKQAEHNIALIANLPKLIRLGYPVVVGASRKSFLGTLTGRGPVEREAATAAAHAIAIFQGARITRVHNIAFGLDVHRVAEALREARQEDDSDLNESPRSPRG